MNQAPTNFIQSRFDESKSYNPFLYLTSGLDESSPYKTLLGGLDESSPYNNKKGGFNELNPYNLIWWD